MLLSGGDGAKSIGGLDGASVASATDFIALSQTKLNAEVAYFINSSRDLASGGLIFNDIHQKSRI